MPAIYLDNASTSRPKPAGVGPAMARAAERLGTPGRGTSASAREAGAIVSRLRARLASFIGVTDPDRVILSSSATDALSGAIQSLCTCQPSVSGRPAHVVTTSIEHNSVRRPLAFAAKQGRVRVSQVAADLRAVVRAEDVLAAVTDETKLVAVTLVSNAIGSIQPVRAIARGLRERSSPALLLVDACQGVGVLEIACEEWGIDLLAFSGHKALLGPQGSAAIYIGPRAYTAGDPAAAMSPWVIGGTGLDSESPDMPREIPARFEAGTVNIPGFAGLLAALEDPGRVPANETLAHERRLCAALESRVANMARVRVLGPAAESRVGMLAISIEGIDPHEVAMALESDAGVIVRAGLQCAPGAHAAVGTLESGGAVRISPGPATTEAEIQACADAIVRLATV